MLQTGTCPFVHFSIYASKKFMSHRAPTRGFLIPTGCTGIVSTPTAGNPVLGDGYLDATEIEPWPTKVDNPSFRIL